jgi:flagellar protein FliL
MASHTQTFKKARATSISAPALVPLIALTVGASALGVFTGVCMPQQEAAPAALRTAAPSTSARPAEAREVSAAYMGAPENPALKLRELPPVVTNLGEPAAAWVRLQAAIVYDRTTISDVDILASQIQSDIVGFLRATTLSSIQGADGLRRLHEELSDRAAIRSENRVKEFIIETIVFQ